MQEEGVLVRYDAPQEAAAREVLRLYPEVRTELQKIIGWPVEFSPTFVLLTEGVLEKMTESPLVTALAVPHRNLILLDVSKMSRHAFVLETTMKHELCHLLLHQYIPENELPKWLDEGVCQWVSNGIAEIIMEKKVSILDQAALSGGLLPLSRLTGHFPPEDRSLLLAYEQSQSVVTYISEKYGADKVLLLLNQLRRGSTLSVAMDESLGISVAELEVAWQRSLRKRETWLLYVSTHLYEILFFAAALLTVAGFVRSLWRRKWRYEDKEED